MHLLNYLPITMMDRFDNSATQKRRQGERKSSKVGVGNPWIAILDDR